MNDIAFSMSAPLPGPAPEVSVSNDMVKRGLLVAPLLIGLLLGVIEYGSLAMVQMRMNDTARDTARRLAVRDLKSEVEGEQFALARLADWDAAFRAQVTLPKFPERDIEVLIRVSMEDAAIMNLVNFGMDGEMIAEVHMVIE